MGDITFSRVIDDAQAKITARSIQKRLADLGNSISYGHALEAAAAVLGFANWPTLQAALNSRVPAAQNQTIIGKFPENAIPSFNGELRSIAVIGDGETRRQALIALVSQAISQYRASKEDVACYVIDAPEMSADAMGANLRNLTPGKPYLIEPGKAGNQFNLFDLPVGYRNLKPSWLRDQKRALLDFLFADSPNRFTRIYLTQIVEDLYDRFSDPQNPQTKVRNFVPGTNEEIDASLAGERPTSWWDVAETLRRSGRFELARLAELTAAPRFEDFVELAAEITPEAARKKYNYQSRDDLEAACQYLSTRAPDVLKHYPFLNCVTSVDTSNASGLVCMMPSDVSADTSCVMYALSIQMCKEHHYGRLLISVRPEMERGLRALEAMNEAATLPKSMMVLGGFQAVCEVSDRKEHMITLVHQASHLLYKNVSDSHAYFVEGGQSGIALFGRYPRSRQNIVYVGTAGDQKKQVDLAVVKDLNLHHTSLALIDSSLPTERSGPGGALLIRDEQGAQHEDYVELARL
jgi:hypothetical protein